MDEMEHQAGVAALERKEIMVSLENQVLRDKLEPLELLVSLVPKEDQVLLVTGVDLVALDYGDKREKKEARALQVLLDPLDLLAAAENGVLLEQKGHQGPLVHKAHRVLPVFAEPPEQMAHLVEREELEHLEIMDRMEQKEIRDLLVHAVNQVDLVPRDLQDRQE